MGQRRATGVGSGDSNAVNRQDICKLRPAASPRVCIITSWNERYKPLAEIAIPNWAAYCERQGYALRGYPGEYHEDPERPETFGDKGKHRLYYDVGGYCEIVMWLDVDSLFTNFDVKVEDVLTNGGRRLDRPFLWTYDDGGPLSGLWIARTDTTTEKHLRRAYEMAPRENNVRHGQIEPNGISDQDAMTRLMNVPPFSRTFGHCFEAAEVGHCYPENWTPGKWLVTFPGRPLEERIALMTEWSEKACITK